LLLKVSCGFVFAAFTQRSAAVRRLPDVSDPAK
jgi:hypothetical protein